MGDKGDGEPQEIICKLPVLGSAFEEKKISTIKCEIGRSTMMLKLQEQTCKRESEQDGLETKS